MSSSSKPRVTRGPAPVKPIKRRRWRNALPELMRDFEGRCAYSMQHHERAGALEVDHFDPRQKNDLIQNYNNLFPASRHCNGKKSDHWPTPKEMKAGCRFLNPCKEMDYGEQIFEDPVTYKLVGITPAAIWHIRICGLNADRLVNERAKRAKHLRLIRKPVLLRPASDFNTVAEMIRAFSAELELMIPEIPAPPAT